MSNQHNGLSDATEAMDRFKTIIRNQVALCKVECGSFLTLELLLNLHDELAEESFWEEVEIHSKEATSRYSTEGGPPATSVGLIFRPCKYFYRTATQSLTPWCRGPYMGSLSNQRIFTYQFND